MASASAVVAEQDGRAVAELVQARLDDSRTVALERWLHDYNYHRPHMAHAGRPPITVVNNVLGNYT